MPRQTKSEPKQGIDRFIGMSWKRAQRELSENAHLLVLTDKPDEQSVEVATTMRDYGLEAALATLCSHLYIRRNGAANAAYRAIELYRGIYYSLSTSRTKGSVRRNSETLAHELVNLESMVFLCRPLEHQFRKRYQRAGLANVLLGLAGRELGKAGTANQVAALGIQRFIEKAFKK